MKKERKTMRRFIALLLTVVMVVGILPTSVMAAAIQEAAPTAVPQEATEETTLEKESPNAAETTPKEEPAEGEQENSLQQAPEEELKQDQGTSAPSTPQATPEANKTPEPITVPELKVDNNITIIESPQSVDAEEGDTVTFSAQVQADKPEDLSYQWQKTTDAGQSEGPQSTKEAIEQKQMAVENTMSGESLDKAAEPLPEEARPQITAEQQATPIQADNEGWEDIAGATATSLSVAVDSELATRAASYRMVARTAEASIATRSASVRAAGLQFAGGNGTERNPFIIRTYDHLNNVRSYNNPFTKYYFLMMSDIDAKGKGWTPIGNRDSPFRGVFNGNGYVIRNLNVTSVAKVPVRTWKGIVSYPGAGLFGNISGAEVKNTGVQNLSVSVTGAVSSEFSNSAVACVGGIAATGGNSSSIVNCFVYGNINANAQASTEAYLLTGGIVSSARFAGDNANTWFEGKIENCYSSVKLNLSTRQARMQGIWRGSIFPSSNLRGSDCPSVIHSFYDTSKEGYSGGGTGRGSADFRNKDKVCKELNGYAESNEMLNYWVMDAETGYPTLKHREPLDFIVRNYAHTYDGNAKEANFTVNHPSPEVIVNREWFYGYYQGAKKIDTPKEVGTYDIKIAIDPSRNYYINTVKGDPYDKTPNDQNKARLIINPKPDKAAPDFGDITYTTDDGAPYTPGNWTSKDVNVTFKLKDHAQGVTRKVQCGNTTYEVDEENNEVSGVQSITVTDNTNKTYTATPVGNGEYRFTVHAENNTMLSSPMTLKAIDKKGNQTVTNTDNVRINKYSLTVDVTAYNDGSTQGVEISPIKGKYVNFAKNQSEFEISVKGAESNPDLYAKTIAYKFVPNDTDPAAINYIEKTFSDPKNPHDVTTTQNGPFNGALYVKATSSSNKIVEISYQIMIEDKAPVMSELTPKAQIGTENGSTTTEVPYTPGSSYAAVKLNFNWNDPEGPISGVSKIEAFRSDTKAKIGETINIKPKDNGTGGLADRAEITCNESGNYKAILVITDVAGNTTTKETEEFSIDSVIPELSVDWKTPAPSQKNPLGENYGFGTWSDKNASIELKTTNANAINGKLTYYYRTAAVGQSFTDNWQKINQSPLNPGDVLTLDTTTQGDYVYQFKAVTESKLTNTSFGKDYAVKIDTQKPDALGVTTSVPANEKGWHTKTELGENKLDITLELNNTDVSKITGTYKVYKLNNGTEGEPTNLSGTIEANAGTKATKTLTLADDGSYKIKMITVDQAGNKTDEQVYTCKIAKKKAEIKSVIHGTPDGDNLAAFENTDIKLRKNLSGDLTIDIESGTAPIEKIEYLLCTDLTRTNNEAPAEGKWITYNSNSKPIVNHFKGSIYIRTTDEAGQITAYRTQNIIVDTKEPQSTIKAEFDTTKWQQSGNFTVTVEDAVAGIKDIAIYERSTSEMASATLVDIKKEKPETAKVSNWNAETDALGNVTKVTFTYKATLPCTNRKTDNQFSVKAYDKTNRPKGEGNSATSNATAYKIETKKPDVKAEYIDSPTGWTNKGAIFELSNKVQADDDIKGGNTYTMSKVVWEYQIKIGKDDGDWTKINADAPTDVPIRFNYPKDVDGTFYFRATSQSGLVNDNIASVPVMVDRKAPQDPAVTVQSADASKEPNTPDHGIWYNQKWPTITITPAEKDPANGVSNESTYYRLYTKGNEATAKTATVGQSILSSVFNKTPETNTGIVKDQNEGKDVLENKGNEPAAITPEAPKAPEAYKAPDPIESGNTVEKKEFYILNIYPESDKEYGHSGNHFRAWMHSVSNEKEIKNPTMLKSLYEPGATVKLTYESGDYQITLHIKGVTTDNFNNAGERKKYLKFSKNEQSSPDLIYYGASDTEAGFDTKANPPKAEYGGKDISNQRENTNTPSALEDLRTYLDGGNGFLVGHDVNSCTVNLGLLMREYLGISEAPKEARKAIGDGGTGIQIMNTGIVTSYPFKMGEKGKMISRASTHTSNESINFGTGTKIWVSFTDGSFVKDATDPDYKPGGKYNYYLATRNNIGISQIGHATKFLKTKPSDGDYGRYYTDSTLGNVATGAEKELLVNTITMLSQKPISQFPTEDGKPKQVNQVISTREQIQKIQNGDTAYPKSGHYVLQKNIILKQGDSIEDFTGAIDGANVTISGVPLFKSIASSGRVKNLKTDGVSLVSGENAGQITNCNVTNAPLVGGANSGTISYAGVTGTITGSGGIAAFNTGAISHCTVGAVGALATITGDAQGGIVGTMTGGSIKNCTVNANITATGNTGTTGIGGIVGRAEKNGTNSPVISDCKSAGTLNAGNVPNAGGLVGSLKEGLLTNSESAMTITAPSRTNVGGLVGSMETSTLEQGKNTGKVTGGSTATGTTGGLVGILSDKAYLRYAVNNGAVSGSGIVGGIAGDNNGSVNSCQATNSVSGGSIMGGAVGRSTGSIQNCMTKSSTITATGGEDPNHIAGFIGELNKSGRINNGYTDADSFVWQNYFSVLQPQISDDGIYTLETWTTDEATNGSAKKQYTINVDTTAPAPFTVTLDNNPFTSFLNKATFNRFFVQTTDVKFSAKDNLSGMETLGYQFYKVPKATKDTVLEDLRPNEDIVEDSDRQATVKNQNETTTSIEPNYKGFAIATATDRAGNSSKVNTDGFIINSTLPRVKAEGKLSGTTTGYGKGEWTNKDVTVDLTYISKEGTENLNGTFVNYQYSIDDGTTWVDISAANSYFTFSAVSDPDKKQTLTFKKPSDQYFRFRAKISGRQDDAKVSSESTTITMRIDKQVPTALVTITGTEITPMPVADYQVYSTQPTVTITATDPGQSGLVNGKASSNVASGLVSEQYTLTKNGVEQAAKAYNDPIVLEDGKYELSYTATDNAGNTATETKKIIVDTTKPPAPKITATLESDSGTSYTEGNWTDQNIHVKAEYATPTPISGNEKIQRTVYKDGVIQGTQWDTNLNPFIITTDGSYEIRFRTVSKSGQISPESSIVVNRKATAPSLEVNTSGVVTTTDPPIWTNQKPSITVSTDGKDIYESVDGTEDSNGKGSSYSPDIKEGKTAYKYSAKNDAGVKTNGDETYYTVAYDSTAPIGGSIVLKDNNGTVIAEDQKDTWFPGIMAAVVTGTKDIDSEKSSPLILHYRAFKEGENKEYTVSNQSDPSKDVTAAISGDIFTDGIWTIQAIVKDTAGNETTLSERTVKISKTKTTLNIILEGTRAKDDDNKEVSITENNITYPVYQNTVSIELNANDPVGIKGKIQYQLVPQGDSIDANGWKDYDAPFRADNFKGHVYAKVTSNAGITTSNNAAFIADGQKPDVSIADTNGKNQKSWSADAYALQVSGGSNTVSGLRKYEYSTDNGTTWQKLESVRNPYDIKTTGKHSFMARSVSNAGITGEPKTYEAWLDNDKIELEIVVNAQPVEGNWSKGALLTPTLKNGTQIPASGLTYYYSNEKNADGSLKNPIKLSSDALSVENSTDNTGKTWYFRAESGTGQKSNVVDGTAFIDKVAPQKPELKIANNKAPDGNDGWYKTPVSLKVETKKAEGQASAKLDVDGQERTSVDGQLLLKNTAPSQESQWETKESLNIQTDGTYTITGRAVDKAENISANTARESVKLDAAKPSIEAVSFKKLDGNPLEKWIYNGAIEVKVKANDITSGVRSITYKTDDGTQKTVMPNSIGEVSFKLDPSLNSRLTLWAEDVAGNVSEQKITDKIQLEVEKPTAVINTTAKPNSTNWYKGQVPYTVQMADNLGIKAYKIYLTEGPITDFNTPGLKPVNQSTFEDDVTIKTAEYDNGMIMDSSDDRVVTVVVTDKAGNERIESRSFKVEVAAPTLGAMLTIPEPESGAPISYDGNATSSAVTAMIQPSEEPKSGIALLQYQIEGVDSPDQWHGISDFSQGQHVVDEEVNQKYRFRLTTLAENISETSFQTIHIDRQLPKAPEISVLDKSGSSVSGKWVKEAPSVTIKTWGSSSASVRKDCAYVYETTKEGAVLGNQSGNLTVSENDKTTEIAIIDEGSYTIGAWGKRGELVDSKNAAEATVLFDKTPPQSASVAYTQESGKRYLQITVSDALSGGASLKYKVNNTAEEKTLVCRDNNVAWLDLSDLKQGDKISIVELTDTAGNTNRLTVPIEELVKDSGPVVTVHPGSFKPVEGWYKDADLALTAEIQIKSRPEDKPANRIIGIDENGNPITKQYPDTDTIANVLIVNAGSEIQYKEYTEPKTEDTYTIAVPQQGKDLTVRVTVTDTWDNVSTATYTLSHDSIGPEAPAMQFTYADGQSIPAAGTVSQEVILTLVPNTEKENPGTSPLDNWEYSLDNGKTWNSAIKISGSNSLKAKIPMDVSKQMDYTVVTRITDRAGNVGAQSAPQTLATKDITPPVCKAITEAGGMALHKAFVNQNPRILEVYAEDPSEGVISSGLMEWNYSLDGGITWQPDNMPWKTTEVNTITLPGDGVYSLTFKAWDRANNVSTAYPQTTIKQDSTAPIIDLNNVIYEQKTKDNTYEKADVHQLAFGSYYNNSLRVTIPVTDALSGADSLSWQCSNGKSGAVQVLDNKAVLEWPMGLKGTVTLSANDKAGNKVNKDFGSWCLEGEAPKAGTLVSEEPISADGWYRSDVHFKIPVSDADSGIATISVQIDKKEPVVSTYQEQVQNAEASGFIDKDGIHRIIVKMTDNAGNTSQRTYTVQVDHNSTLEAYIVENDGKDSIVDPDYWRSDDPVSLKATAIAELMDNIVSFSYTIDGGKTWSAPQSFKDKNAFDIHDDGIYQYEDEEGILHNLIGIRATDKQGKQMQSLFVTINKDTDAPPFPNSKVNPEEPTGNMDVTSPEKVWYKEIHPEVLLNPAPQEENRAPVTSRYTLLKTGSVFENPLALGAALQEGKNILRLEAWDEAGNVVKDKGLPYKEQVIYLDTKPPVFEAPVFAQAKARSVLKALANSVDFGNFAKEAVKVSLPVSDETSGVRSVWVQIGNKMPIQATIQNGRAEFEIPAGTKDSIVTYWSEDIAGNKTETLKLEKTSDKWTVDVEAPVYSEVKTNLTPGADGYYSNDLQFELPITDLGSGLASITWQLDTQSPTAIDPTVFTKGRLDNYVLKGEVTGEGIHTVTITATDNAGNTSTNNLTFHVDYSGSAVAYVTLADESPVDANKWYSEDKVVLKAMSESSFDIDTWQYSTDGGQNWTAPLPWSENPTFEITENGFYDAHNSKGILIRIQDKEPTSYVSRPITLRKDSTVPDFPAITVPEPNGNTDEKGITWYKGTLPILAVTQTPSPEDLAPVSSRFGLNGMETGFNGTRSLSAELDQGENTLWTAAQKSTGKKAQDEKGNDKKTKTLYVDTAAPELVSIQYEDLKNNPAEALINWLSFGNFYNEGIRAVLEVKDTTSGLDALTYTIGGKTVQKTIKGNDPNTAVISFDIPVGTDGTVTFILSDKAGNQSAEYTLKKESDQWVLEDTAPVIGTVATDTKASEDGWYNKPVTYSIALGDADSGLAKLTAFTDSIVSKTLERETFGDKKHKNYTYTDTMSGDGIHDLNIQATDNAGNTSDRSFTLKIDTQAPTELKLTGMPLSGSDIQPVTLTAHAVDALSGLKSWQYTTDGGKTWNTAQIWDGNKHQIKLSEVGTYDVSFAVTDKAGNRSVLEDTVQITIKEKPLPKPSPTLSINSPQNGDQKVALDQAAVSFSSDQPIVKGTGSIALYRKDNHQKLAEVNASSSRVTLVGQRVTAIFQTEYDPNTEYYVVVGENFVLNDENTGNQVFGGINDWYYKTVIDDTRVKILGFNVDLVKRSQIGGEEKTVQIAAVKSGEVPKQYNLLTTADYLGDDGKPYVKMKVYPQYNAKPGDVKITAKDKDGKDVGQYIHKNADGTFSVEMPKDAGRIIVSIVLGDDPNNAFNVVILSTDYEGEINSTGIEHRMDPSQILNSVDLTKEINDPLTKFVKVILKLNQKSEEDLTEEEKTILKQATDKIIEEEQRQGTEVQYLHLAAQMGKWVTMLNQEGQEQEAVYSDITSLANKLRVTIVLPQELQQYFSYKIVLIDSKTGTVLEPMISDDGSQLSFDISDLATYSLAAFPTRVSLNYTAEQGGQIQGNTSQNLDIFKDGESVKAVPDAGYRFVDWNDGYSLAERQEKGVGSNRTYTARFEPIVEDTVVLSYNAAEGGRIDGSSRQTLKKGEDGQMVTAVANTGWHFTGWSDGSTEASRLDVNVQADLQVTASFGKDAPNPPIPPTPPTPNPPTPNPAPTEEQYSIVLQRSGRVINMGMAGRNPLSGNEGADKPGNNAQQIANAKAGQSDSSQQNISKAAEAARNCKLHWIILAIAVAVIILTELNLRKWRNRNKAMEAALESEEEDDNV